jgi:anti-sigma regulatory factor (Ser/Thr protein kinase)
MVRLRKRGEEVRQFILENVETNPKEFISLASKHFQITRQAVNKHIRLLIEQGALKRVNKGHYEHSSVAEWSDTFLIKNTPSEDVVWREKIAPHINQLPDNARHIWNYGFTEIFNNAIDHSQSETIFVKIIKTASSTRLIIADYGIGIFHKIKQEMNLLDERHAVLELTKGKLTTDPTRHSGEGIFFTSRMVDEFYIISGEVSLSHSYGKDEDWIMENKENHPGTWISMKLKNNTSRTAKEIFDKFTTDDEYGFSKTVVPVRLAQYGTEKLVSRSQAKRLLERVDRFKIVLFDLTEVESIGQAFADEVFRVFSNLHPDTNIIPINANDTVMQMIKRAKTHDKTN